MHDSADRLDFAPPPQPAAVRAFVLAVLAHVLLLLALTWGVNWKRESKNVAAEAELWSGVPQQPAPKVEPKVVQAASAAGTAAPARAQGRAPARPAGAQGTGYRAGAGEEAPRTGRAQTGRTRTPEEARGRPQEARRGRAREKAGGRAQAAAGRAEAPGGRSRAKGLEEKKKKEEQAKAAKEKAASRPKPNRLRPGVKPICAACETGRDRTERQQLQWCQRPFYQLRRPNRCAHQAEHPAPEDVPGNPPVIIEVRTAPDGTIVSQRVVKSSGNSAWDESAIRAIIATGSLPGTRDGIDRPVLRRSGSGPGLTGSFRRPGSSPG